MTVPTTSALLVLLGASALASCSARDPAPPPPPAGSAGSDAAGGSGAAGTAGKVGAGNDGSGAGGSGAGGSGAGGSGAGGSGAGGSGAAGSAGAPGACTNPTDAAIVAMKDATASHGSGCGTMCFLSATQETCATDCMKSMAGFSDACAACWGAVIACGIKHCAGPCLGDTKSPGCIDCNDMFCVPAFEVCAGKP